MAHRYAVAFLAGCLPALACPTPAWCDGSRIERPATAQDEPTNATTTAGDPGHGALGSARTRVARTNEDSEHGRRKDSTGGAEGIKDERTHLGEDDPVVRPRGLQALLLWMMTTHDGRAR